jgi:hypothetical protein
LLFYDLSHPSSRDILPEEENIIISALADAPKLHRTCEVLYTFGVGKR